jgi:hypothetical protein
MESCVVVDVSDWTVIDVEPGGDEPKEWLAEPIVDGASGETRWLFKPVRFGVFRDGRTYRQGTDWAECVACQLGRLIRVPVAVVELAQRGDVEGAISRHVAPPKWSHDGASVRLSDFVAEYRPRTPEDKRQNRVGHRLDTIELILDGVLGPPETEYATWRAFDVFGGLLLLDAWIGNQDRHEDNWGIMTGPDGELRLSPAFDQ